MFLGSVMICVPRWCNGLCSSVVLLFVSLCGVMVCVSQWSTGLCSSVE